MQNSLNHLNLISEKTNTKNIHYKTKDTDKIGTNNMNSNREFI